MDNLLYVAMTGAKENFNSLAVRGNNLANASTTGFKADFEQARSMQAFGEGLPTRVFSLAEKPGQNMVNGAINTTGRDLDVAINGDGFIAVTDSTGAEAYTRDGSLIIDQDGNLKTTSGRSVLDVNGEAINIQMPVQKIFINQDGTVAGIPEGMESSNIEEFAQIKLVKPSIRDVYKGDDGLFRRKDGVKALEDPTVRLENGALEASNVNAAEEMINVIRLQRMFTTQVKLMKTAEEMDQQSNNLMRIS
ncbi:MAG: flagellar basal body rod protein FlgF [Succinivibrionaceae bacterium]|nr:flagellar basal body rod protein FlgF [Succinivibrionaceae bacterium]